MSRHSPDDVELSLNRSMSPDTQRRCIYSLKVIARSRDVSDGKGVKGG